MSATSQTEANYDWRDIIFSSTKTIIQKAEDKSTKQQVLVKKPVEDFPSFGLIESFKKDFQFTKTLHQSYPKHFVNMLEMIEQKNGAVMLVEESEGEGLQFYLQNKGKLESKEFITIAIEMAKSVHYAHTKQILHRDIKIANFIKSSLGENVKLIDFGLGVMVSRKSPSVSCRTPIGTFNYMSPEQTGRVGKNVDFRSDIYSLGISFYELLTGSVPFNGDLLALVHSHITKKLPIIENVPKVFNDVIQKMCAKNPMKRYKSALGVVNDLEFIKEHLDSIPEDFQIGQNDIQEFQIPNKLYGREKEIKMLKKAIESEEKCNMCLVSGYSGMGKSKLVEELMKDQDLNLLMSYGKFDQFNRLTPYYAFINIIKSLVTKVVSTENKQEKKNLLDQLQIELSDEFGGVLCSVIPEVELLIGKKNIPEALNTIKDTQERLFNSFIQFLSCFSTDSTLVLVIDDLQWADAASFEFLEKLLKTPRIFIIGAYRNNEVGESHPLTSLINEHKSIIIIQLDALKLKDLNQMVSHTLLSNEETTMKLSELIFKKTLGNPFFSREFINTLYQEELIVFKNGKWEWDVDKVEKMNYSSNVIDFMIKNLKKISKKMQKLLNRAACIGNTFKVEELKLVWNENSEIEIELIELMKEGWIHQINSNEYQFFHDRLQQASYELYDQEEAKKIHLIIGKILLEEFTKQKLVEQNIFSIINHLNNAKSIFENQIELLELNLIAAKKSLENSAFSASLKFSGIALELLPKDAWETNYEIAFQCYSVHANTLYANSNLKECEEQYNILLEKAQGRFDKLTVYSNYMKMASLSHQYEKAYNLFITTFKMFDLTKDIPFNDVMGTLNWTLELKKKIDMEVQQIGGMKNILKLKKCTDKELILLMTIMFESIDVIFICPTANPVMVITDSLVGLYLYLTEGLAHNAPLGLGFAGWIYSFFFKEKDGYQLTLATEKLLSQDKDPKYNTVCVQFLLGVGNITGGNFKKQIYHLDSAIKYAMNHGEYLFGAYSVTHSSICLVANGENFATLLPKLKKRQHWLKEIKNHFAADFAEVKTQFVSDLAGVSKYNPQFILPNVRTMKCGDTFISTMEGILHFHKGEYEEALKKFDESDPFAANEQGLMDYYELPVYHCLTLVHFYKKNKSPKHLERIAKYLDDYKPYAMLSVEYLEPRFKLMELAFKSISETDKLSIVSQLDEVLESATKYGLIILAAVISEFILEYSDENNFPKNYCRMYFNQTLKIWNGLSAKTKVDQFKKKYFRYMSSHRSSSSSATTTTSMSTTSDSTVSDNSFGNDSLDMMSIIKASQALSVELTTSNLISKVMSIIIENTGAESGFLFLSGSGGEFLESSISNGKVSSIHKLTNEIEENEVYCNFLFTLSKSIKKTIIISDVESSEYSDNAYLQREKIKSLCIHPIYKAHKYIGSIYLENRTLDGIFDENRKQILEHISSQLAISYENAKLYDEMNSLNLAYERFLPKEFLNQLGKGDVRNIKKGNAVTKNMCVLFSDIRSFTNITEKMNPEESFSFINGILSYLAPIISKNNGFIDKFFGDSIMALFPFSVDDAIKCGFEMQSSLKRYNLEFRKDNLNPVEIGIGIHYGNVMLGTIGAEDRIDATVISDTVNTASRVESLTKTLGANFVVTEELLKNSSNSYSNRYIGTYLLQGKDVPMKLFHMLNKDQKEIDTDKFNQGMKEFESNQFKNSELIFSSLNDFTSKYLENVSKVYQNYVFDSNWFGEIKIDKDGGLMELKNASVVDSSINELTNEQEMKIIEKLMKDGMLKNLLKSCSKESPDVVRSLIE